MGKIRTMHRLSRTLFRRLALAVAFSGVVFSLVAVIVPQKAQAQRSYEAFRYQYIVHDNLLTIRAYNDDECGGGGPEGDAAMEFVSLDGGRNFGASHIDTDCIARNGGPLMRNQSPIEDIGDLANIFVGERASDAEMRYGGSTVARIQIGHPERVEAYRRCFENGDPSSTCVDRVGQEILDAQPPPEEEERNCETEGADLSWLLCPILFALDNGIEELDEQINDLLRVPNSYINDADVEETWARIRNIAYVILVPIMLVMVIGTALGFEFFSAYTVKRALPRLIAATIFIALSFELTSFLVILTNNIGSGLGGLISSSFGGYDNITLASVMTPDNVDTSLLLSGGVFVALTGLNFILASLPILLSLAFTTALGLFIGIILLSFRQLLIIALLMLAPLAILAWIFPGNDKLWKLWWGTFSKLLLMYPLIVIMIAAGKSFASITADVEGNLIGTIIKLVAYIGPYFLIPATFKFAGGLFANIAGMTNDRTRGLFDKQREKRAARLGQNARDWKTGSLPQHSIFGIPGLRNLGATSNRFGRAAGAGYKGRFGFGQRGDIVTDTQRANAAADKMKTPEFIAQRDNDPVLFAAMAGRSFDESVRNQMRLDPNMSRDQAEKNARQAQATIGLNSVSQMAAAQQLVMTGTGYSNLPQMVRSLGIAAAGSEASGSRLAGFANALSKKADRPDLAPGFGALNTAVQGASRDGRVMRDAGGNVMYQTQVNDAGETVPVLDAEGNRIPMYYSASAPEAQRQQRIAAAQSVDVISMLRGKTPQLRNQVDTVIEGIDYHTNRLNQLDQDIASGALTGQALVEAEQARDQSRDTLTQLVGQVTQFHDQRSYGSVGNQAEVKRLVDTVRNTRDANGRNAEDLAVEALQGPVTVYDAQTRQPMRRARQEEANRDLDFARASRRGGPDPNDRDFLPPRPADDDE